MLLCDYMWKNFCGWETEINSIGVEFKAYVSNLMFIFQGSDYPLNFYAFDRKTSFTSSRRLLEYSLE